MRKRNPILIHAINDEERILNFDLAIVNDLYNELLTRFEFIKPNQRIQICFRLGADNVSVFMGKNDLEITLFLPFSFTEYVFLITAEKQTEFLFFKTYESFRLLPSDFPINRSVLTQLHAEILDRRYQFCFPLHQLAGKGNDISLLYCPGLRKYVYTLEWKVDQQKKRAVIFEGLAGTYYANYLFHEFRMDGDGELLIFNEYNDHAFSCDLRTGKTDRKTYTAQRNHDIILREIQSWEVT